MPIYKRSHNPTLCLSCPVRAELEAEIKHLQTEHREFIDGLSSTLQAHGVPAMPSWRSAIDYLARMTPPTGTGFDKEQRE